MACADGVAVAIAAHDDHIEFRARRFDARGDWERTSVNGMKAKTRFVSYAMNDQLLGVPPTATQPKDRAAKTAKGTAIRSVSVATPKNRRDGWLT